MLNTQSIYTVSAKGIIRGLTMAENDLIREIMAINAEAGSKAFTEKMTISSNFYFVIGYLDAKVKNAKPKEAKRYKAMITIIEQSLNAENKFTQSHESIKKALEEV
jgi:hypothetical protein